MMGVAAVVSQEEKRENQATMKEILKPLARTALTP